MSSAVRRALLVVLTDLGDAVGPWWDKVADKFEGWSEVDTFWGGCGAVRRSAFVAVGGFDEARYPRPQIEDNFSVPGGDGLHSLLNVLVWVCCTVLYFVDVR